MCDHFQRYFSVKNVLKKHNEPIIRAWEHWDKILFTVKKYFVGYGEINIQISQIGLIWRN